MTGPVWACLCALLTEAVAYGESEAITSAVVRLSRAAAFMAHASDYPACTVMVSTDSTAMTDPGKS